MYAGHFAAGLAVKVAEPRAPMAALLGLAFLPDLLWLGFSVGGIELVAPGRWFDGWSHSIASIILRRSSGIRMRPRISAISCMDGQETPHCSGRRTVGGSRRRSWPAACLSTWRARIERESTKPPRALPPFWWLGCMLRLDERQPTTPRRAMQPFDQPTHLIGSHTAGAG
jgi:hypothetical protein